MDFDVKLKADIAFSDEGMMLVLDMKLCEKERKEEEKRKEKEAEEDQCERKKKKRRRIRPKLTEPSEKKKRVKSYG